MDRRRDGRRCGASVSVWLTGEAVWFAVPGRQPDLELPYATPVAELIETVRLGGSITVCTQCAARRELVVQDLVRIRDHPRRRELRGGSAGRQRPGAGLLDLTTPFSASRSANASDHSAYLGPTFEASCERDTHHWH